MKAKKKKTDPPMDNGEAMVKGLNEYLKKKWEAMTPEQQAKATADHEWAMKCTREAKERQRQRELLAKKNNQP